MDGPETMIALSAIDGNYGPIALILLWGPSNSVGVVRPRAAAGQMGALSRIVLLCPLPQILLMQKQETTKKQTPTIYKSK